MLREHNGGEPDLVCTGGAPPVFAQGIPAYIQETFKQLGIMGGLSSLPPP